VVARSDKGERLDLECLSGGFDQLSTPSFLRGGLALRVLRGGVALGVLRGGAALGVLRGGVVLGVLRGGVALGEPLCGRWMPRRRYPPPFVGITASSISRCLVSLPELFV